MEIFGKKLARPTAFALVAALLIGAVTWKKFVAGDAPDLKVFHTAGKFALSEPGKIYYESPDRFLYPPFAALLFAPLGALDWPNAQLLWYLLSLVAFFFLARPSWPQFFAVLILWRYFAINQRYGQVNAFLLLAMYAVHNGARRNQAGAAGAWFAFTSSLKVFPAVQGLDLLLRRNWRALGYAALVALGLALIPFFAWGPETALAVYRDFPTALVNKGLPTHSHNQSFLGILLRCFHTFSFFIFPVTWAYWRIIELPLPLLQAVAFGAGFALTLLAWKRAWARQNALDTLSATCFSILFLSHIVWKPYFIFLLPALTQCCRAGDRKHYILLGAFMLCGPFLSAELYGKYASYAEAACVHLVAAIFLFSAWWRLPKCNGYASG